MLPENSEFTHKVFHISEPAPVKFNLGLTVSTKGVVTWDVTVLNAASSDEVVAKAKEVHDRMVSLYGLPKEPEKVAK